jgi:hypothetical protein
MTKSNEIAKAMRAITEFREELKETGDGARGTGLSQAGT